MVVFSLSIQNADKGMKCLGGWGFSAAEAGEVTRQSSGIRWTMFCDVQSWYPYMTPIGIGGASGGHLIALSGSPFACCLRYRAASTRDKNEFTPTKYFPSLYTISFFAGGSDACLVAPISDAGSLEYEAALPASLTASELAVTGIRPSYEAARERLSSSACFETSSCFRDTSSVCWLYSAVSTEVRPTWTCANIKKPISASVSPGIAASITCRPEGEPPKPLETAPPATMATRPPKTMTDQAQKPRKLNKLRAASYDLTNLSSLTTIKCNYALCVVTFTHK